MVVPPVVPPAEREAPQQDEQLEREHCERDGPEHKGVAGASGLYRGESEAEVEVEVRVGVAIRLGYPRPGPLGARFCTLSEPCQQQRRPR
jgi:hypothetical protein